MFAKFAGVGITAFIFDVTREKLLEMSWFEKLYEFILMIRDKAKALVAPIKQRIRDIAALLVIDKLRQRVTTKVDVIDALALTAFFGKSVEDFLNAPKFSSDMSRLNNAMQRLDNRDLRIISSMLAAMLGNEDGK